MWRELRPVATFRAVDPLGQANAESPREAVLTRGARQPKLIGLHAIHPLP